MKYTYSPIGVKGTEVAHYSGQTMFVRINLPLFSTVLPSVLKQQLLDGRTVENKGKVILTEIFP